MNFIKQIVNKIKGIEGRDREEIIYASVLEELEKGNKKKGLWAKAIADSEGDKDKIESFYIKYRVQSIEDEIEIAENKIRDKEQKIQDAIDLKEQQYQNAIDLADQKESDEWEEADRKDTEEFLESLNHWEKYGHRYFTYPVYLIYASWFFSPHHSFFYQVWVRIYGFFYDLYPTNPMFVLVACLLIVSWFQPWVYGHGENYEHYDKEDDVTRHGSMVFDRFGIKFLVFVFFSHYFFGDRTLFDLF